jgi:undecaprenyl pyrophosphate synthase
MQRYTKTLIEEETNLSTMIEQALKQNAKEDEDASNNTESDIVDDADMSIEDLEKSLEDKDFEDFNEFLDSEQNSIDDTLNALLNGEGDI